MDPQGLTLVADLSAPPRDTDRGRSGRIADDPAARDLLEEAHRSDWFWRNPSRRSSGARGEVGDQAAPDAGSNGAGATVQRRKQQALLDALAASADRRSAQEV
jgi:hypothetical protein